MKVLVIDHRDRGLKNYFINIDHEAKNEPFLKLINNHFQPDPSEYSITFLHCQDDWQGYCDEYGDNNTIVLFSGSGIAKNSCQRKLVSAIPWAINVKQHIPSFRWDHAFKNFKKGDKFPVHLLKTSLQNTCGFLILLQGYIAVNFSDDDPIKIKLLPHWDKIKDKLTINKPEQTRSKDWWDVIPKDDLLFELQNTGKQTDTIKTAIDNFFEVISSPSNSSIIELYKELKGFIS